MKKPSKSEKLFLEKIAHSAHALQQVQHGLEIGQLIYLMRQQLKMSQRALARRSKIPQPSISKIESGSLKPNIATLEKILNSMDCDLLITIVPKTSCENIRKKQALKKAKKKVSYLQGTMSLEKQEPNQTILKELLDEAVNDLLNSKNSKLWDEE